ncbi:hypothetical protein [Paenibacillus sp. NPDC058174]|uniref:hypothetical protein n=1 Tax=Paenibacillus sp. NPDC058174 TaxID=3346366 RepID=UPI0036D9F0B6
MTQAEGCCKYCNTSKVGYNRIRLANSYSSTSTLKPPLKFIIAKQHRRIALSKNAALPWMLLIPAIEAYICKPANVEKAAKSSKPLKQKSPLNASYNRSSGAPQHTHFNDQQTLPSPEQSKGNIINTF